MKPVNLVLCLLLLPAMLILGSVEPGWTSNHTEESFLDNLPPEIAEKTLVKRLEAGEMIPEFSLKTIDGQVITNQTIKGKPTILAFFAIDNDTRRKRSLELLEAVRKLREQYGDGVNVYGICSDREGCEAPDVKKAAGNIPIMDDTERVGYALFGVFMMPTTMIISPEGKLLTKLPHSGDVQAAMDNWLKVALGEQTEEQLQEKLTVREPERTAEEREFLHHMQLAKVMVKRRMYPQAVAEFSKAAALQPDDIEPLVEQGFILLKIEKFVEAETLFLKVLDMNPDSIEAIAGLGLALHAQGKDDEAVLELEDAANVTKPMPRVLIALAEIYAAAGDKDKAIKTYAKAFKQLGRELERCESMEEVTE